MWRHIDRRGADECWPWTGRITVDGYGQAYVDREHRSVGAHRVMYELLVGPIPDGLQIDHLCRNRACVNPAHLEAVTQLVNWERGQAPSALARNQTECLRGHDLTDPANLKPNSRGARQCRACVNLGRRERYVRTGR